MNRKAYLPSAAILCLVSTHAACSRNDNDIGTILYDSGATGGASGSGMTSGGSGGSGGAGGTMVLGGTSGSGGSGGSVGTGGNASDASEPGYCAPCVDDSIGLQGCPTERPTTKDDLDVLCDSLSMARWTTVTLTFGDCVLLVVQPAECSVVAPDPDVQVLRVSGLGGNGFACHYSRITGELLGSVAITDFNRYCNGTSTEAATSGVKNQWCIASGQTAISITCPAPAADGGLDGPASD